MKKKIIILCVFMAFAIALNAQEKVVGLYGNPEVEKNSEKLHSLRNQSNDTLELPFFDDFSLITVFPNQEKWIGYDVFVNDTWAVNPISYGVASFDVADSTGEIRSLASSAEVSDILTSRPINLEYNLADSLYLSFAVQRGGFALRPEEKDSLVLQFSSPDTTWYSVWNMPGGESDNTFHKIMVPITDDKLLVKGFQFRFLGYGSTEASSPEPSFNTNNDVWNLDYVLLDKNRTMNDTVINDIAMMYNVQSVISEYEAVPWKHYLANTAGVSTSDINFIYRSNGELSQAINRQYIISDMLGNGSTYASGDDSENIFDHQIMTYSKPVDYQFNSNVSDSACFEVKAFIQTDEESEGYMYRWNDTVRYQQKFYNYYAYDDGIPEVGYGIGGVGTNSASLACRFNPIHGDTLRGVNIYFNKVLNQENEHYFYLMVWDDDGGVPGDTLVQQVGVRPLFKDSLYQYVYYPLDTPVYVSSAFHIGWTKTTDDMLNVGFDKNRDASSKVHLNMFGAWQPASIAGAVMVRPVFSETPIVNAIEKPMEIIEFSLYPNPAVDLVTIETQVAYDKLCLINIYGQIVKEYDARNTFSVSDLQSGMYVVALYNKGRLLGTQKLLIRP